MPSLVTDLDAIRRLAEERHDEFEVMRYRLELDDDLDDGWLDAHVERVAAPIIAAIDCTQCANCCRVLDVYLTPDDARQLGDCLSISDEEVTARHIDHEAARKVEEWGKLRAKPCAFLKGKLCSVYAHRPESCRTYPVFTPDFRWLLTDTMGGAGICPIIYNVLSEIAAQVEAGVIPPPPGA